MGEVWASLKNIVEHGEHYEVSNLGQVRSIARINHVGAFHKGKMIKPHKCGKGYKNGGGYLTVPLSFEGKKRGYKVHRLVALTFVNNPNNKPQVNHIDGNKENNEASNLEWVTNSENQIHAIENNLTTREKGADRYCALLSEKDVLYIRNVLYPSKKESKLTMQEISEMYGVSNSTIQKVISKENWKHI